MTEQNKQGSQDTRKDNNPNREQASKGTQGQFSSKDQPSQQQKDQNKTSSAPKRNDEIDMASSKKQADRSLDKKGAAHVEDEDDDTTSSAGKPRNR